MNVCNGKKLCDRSSCYHYNDHPHDELCERDGCNYLRHVLGLTGKIRYVTCGEETELDLTEPAGCGIIASNDAHSRPARTD